MADIVDVTVGVIDRTVATVACGLAYPHTGLDLIGNKARYNNCMTFLIGKPVDTAVPKL